MSSVDQAMRVLGYTPQWVELGVVDESTLLEQLVQYRESDDECPEHYRAAAFLSYLRNKRDMSDEELECALSLEDGDYDLREDRVLKLVWSGLLSDAQYQRLSSLDLVQEKRVAKEYERIRLIRLIDAEGLSPNAVAQAKESGDSWVHEHMLEHPELDHTTLAWLVECGATRRIQNMAKNLSRSKRFKKAPDRG